jgi:hypothetical protein
LKDLHEEASPGDELRKVFEIEPGGDVGEVLTTGSCLGFRIQKDDPQSAAVFSYIRTVGGNRVPRITGLKAGREPVQKEDYFPGDITVQVLIVRPHSFSEAVSHKDKGNLTERSSFGRERDHIIIPCFKRRAAQRSLGRRVRRGGFKRKVLVVMIQKRGRRKAGFLELKSGIFGCPVKAFTSGKTPFCDRTGKACEILADLLYRLQLFHGLFFIVKGAAFVTGKEEKEQPK